MSTSSRLWNGEPGKYPEFRTELQTALQREECGSIIIPFGQVGHVADKVNRPYPPLNSVGINGVYGPTPMAVFDRYLDDCRKNQDDNQRYEKLCGKGLAIIYGMLGPDALRKIKHIREDRDNLNKQKAEWIMDALEVAFVGHTAAVRTELKSGIDDLQDIDSRETALLAIEKINDVNAELRRHIDPFTGLANHFQSSDADKIEKFLNLMQGGVGTIFYDSKLFLIRARDAGTLHWAALVAEIERTCDNIKADELKGSTPRVSNVSRISQGKSYEDGIEEGKRAAMADRGNSRSRGREHSSGRYDNRGKDGGSGRYDNRDRNRDRSEGRDNYHRSRREPSRDKDYDRRYSRQDESRRDGGNSRYDQREDSRDRSRGDSSGRDRYSRNDRDQGRERSTGRESENERFERRVADEVKKALGEKKGK